MGKKIEGNSTMLREMPEATLSGKDQRKRCLLVMPNWRSLLRQGGEKGAGKRAGSAKRQEKRGKTK